MYKNDLIETINGRNTKYKDQMEEPTINLEELTNNNNRMLLMLAVEIKSTACK
jgi:hypothetical protein